MLLNCALSYKRPNTRWFCVMISLFAFVVVMMVVKIRRRVRCEEETVVILLEVGG